MINNYVEENKPSLNYCTTGNLENDEIYDQNCHNEANIEQICKRLYYNNKNLNNTINNNNKIN